MITASELNGVLGMMPAFATPEAVDIRANKAPTVQSQAVTKYYQGGIR